MSNTVNPDFFKNLNPKLIELGIDESKIKNINELIESTNKEGLENAQKQQQLKAKEQEQTFLQLGLEILKNPSAIRTMFPTNWIKYLYDFLIAFMVVFALIFLSTQGLLEKGQTSTILSGIIGYLIGNAVK